MYWNTKEQHFSISTAALISLCVLALLFFTARTDVLGATTTDSINITLTVEEAVTPTPTPPLSGGGGPIGTPYTVQIIDVEIEVATNTATVLWKTTRPAISTLSWGETTEYVLGTLTGLGFIEEHRAILPDLTPDTRYFFFIEASDVQSKQGYSGTFTTLTLPDVTPPANVSNFQAVGSETYVDLSWNNPPDEDFDIVRIVRSDTFYPTTPFEGTVIYEGRGESTRDTDVVPGITYYYSAFALDESGNPSEGSIAIGMLLVEGIPPEIKPPFEEFPPAPKVPQLIEQLKLLHIDFIQDGKKIPHINNRVPINGSKELTISIDYERLPEILKTIAFTIVDPEDSSKTFSFLLRVTPDKTTYRTTLSPFVRGGTYEFFVNILDHKNQGLKKLDGKMLVAAVIEEIEAVEAVGKVLVDFVTEYSCFLLLLLLLLIILVILYVRLFRKKNGQKLYIFFLVLIFVVITILLILYGDVVGEKVYCFLFLMLLIALLLYMVFRLIKKLVKKDTEDEEDREDQHHLSQTHLL